ncbi:MAG: hypothetical protein ACOCP8_02180 [archaeon]
MGEFERLKESEDIKEKVKNFIVKKFDENKRKVDKKLKYFTSEEEYLGFVNINLEILDNKIENGKVTLKMKFNINYACKEKTGLVNKKVKDKIKTVSNTMNIIINLKEDDYKIHRVKLIKEKNQRWEELDKLINSIIPQETQNYSS